MPSAPPSASLHLDEYQVEEVLRRFAAKHAADLTGPSLAAAVSEALSECQWQSVGGVQPAAAATPPHTPQALVCPSPRDLQIQFQHDCLALGCRDTDCTLCQYNPVRACGRHFSKKYLVGDVLKATCGAPLCAEIHNGGARVDKDVPGVMYEVSLLDGVLFKEKGGDSRQLSLDDIKACIKFTNHREEALLQLKSGVNASGSRKINLRAEHGRLVLPELHVTDSSEALLTGRKPPFRLIVFPVSPEDGTMLADMAYAVSEEFVVATRRVKLANKSEIPLMDDHVGKIEHIGRETMKKLLDLRSAAAEGGMELQLPDRLRSISTVGQFVELVGIAEKVAHLKKELQYVLKLSKEKWEEAANHALQAVMSDFRPRLWLPPARTAATGLLFSAKYGAVQLTAPVAVVPQPDLPGNALHSIIAEDELEPSSLPSLRALKQEAVSAWWAAGHPGWSILKEAPPAAAGLPLLAPPVTARAVSPKGSGRAAEHASDSYAPSATGRAALELCPAPQATPLQPSHRAPAPPQQQQMPDVGSASCRVAQEQPSVGRAAHPSGVTDRHRSAGTLSPARPESMMPDRRSRHSPEQSNAVVKSVCGRPEAGVHLTGLSALAAAAAAAAAEDYPLPTGSKRCISGSDTQDSDVERSPAKVSKQEEPSSASLGVCDGEHHDGGASRSSFPVRGNGSFTSPPGVPGPTPGGSASRLDPPPEQARKVTITTSSAWPGTQQQQRNGNRARHSMVGPSSRTAVVSGPTVKLAYADVPSPAQVGSSDWMKLQMTASAQVQQLCGLSNPLTQQQQQQQHHHHSLSAQTAGHVGPYPALCNQLVDHSRHGGPPAASPMRQPPTRGSPELLAWEPHRSSHVSLNSALHSLDSNSSVTLTLAQLAMLARTLAGASESSGDQHVAARPGGAAAAYPARWNHGA